MDVHARFAQITTQQTIPGTKFFTKDEFSTFADIDNDGKVEGVDPCIAPCGPAADDADEFVYAQDPSDPRSMLAVPMLRNALCMWSESGAGPTGHSFVCANQNDSETSHVYVTECDADGNIVEIYYENLEAKVWCKRTHMRMAPLSIQITHSTT